MLYIIVPENCLNTTKKKATTFSRLLRGLKTSHRKEKHGGCSPKQARQARTQGMPPQRVSFKKSTDYITFIYKAWFLCVLIFKPHFHDH